MPDKPCPPCDADAGRDQTPGRAGVDYDCPDCGQGWSETPIHVEAGHLARRVIGSLFGKKG